MTIHVRVRVCRDCGEEYRPEAVRCADCGGDLEDRFVDDEAGWSGPATPGAATAPAAPDLSGHRAVFVSGFAADLVPLAERLREAAIGFHFAERPADSEGHAARYSLLVPEGDVAAARRALRPLLGTEGEELEEDTHDETGRSHRRCPACKTDLTPDLAECPGCGLGLGPGEGGSCPRCGSPVGEGDSACPTCGTTGNG